MILSYLVAYFVLSGLNKNINLILSFTKKHKLLHIYFGILIVSSIYNAYDLNSAFIGILRVFTMYSRECALRDKGYYGESCHRKVCEG